MKEKIRKLTGSPINLRDQRHLTVTRSIKFITPKVFFVVKENTGFLSLKTLQVTFMSIFTTAIICTLPNRDDLGPEDLENV